jgi:multidrug efflux pump
MLISDLSVRRPVFAAVISLLLVIIGLASLFSMTIREFPDMDPPIISIRTEYRGAASDIVEKRVTQLIEEQVAGISDVDKISSASYDERSIITIEFGHNRDADAAANDVRERVARILDKLPDEADPPEVAKQDTGAEATLWLNLSSETRSMMELSDFADRYLVDALSMVEGVAFVSQYGERRQAMRIWIDAERLAARGLTVADIEAALRRENVQIPSGRIESTLREFTLRTNTGLVTEDDFRRLVLMQGADGYLVRLGEVADIELAPEDVRSFSRTNGKSGATTVGIIPQAKANMLELNSNVLDKIEAMKATLPKDIHIDVNMDMSQYIRASLKEVGIALGISLLLVLVVIYAFIGTFRATLIPALTIPISIVAAAIVMAPLNFSLNTLTLLGFVLAIGLVVDDAIVVLENIFRRIEMKEPVLLAAINGSREIGFAVISTTLVLAAVILPVSFMPGKAGMLFSEFGISLAAAVLFSALISLTLVPMLATKLFADGLHRGRVAHALDRVFSRVSIAYRRALAASIRHPAMIIGSALLAFLSSLMLLPRLPFEFSPREDTGWIFTMITAPEGASLDYTLGYTAEVEKEMQKLVDSGEALRVISRSGTYEGGSDVNLARAFSPLVPWDERERSAQELALELNARIQRLVGVNVYAFAPGSWTLGQGDRPVQIVLGGTDYDELAEWRDIVVKEAAMLPGISNVQSDYKARKPKLQVSIDRDRAADLGVSLSNVGRTLETMLGSRVVTTFIERGEEYDVIVQGKGEQRRTPGDLESIYVRSERSGKLIPLSNLITLKEVAGPIDLRRFDRMRAVTISASVNEGYSLGNAIADMERIIRTRLPEGVQISYNGESRDFKQAGNAIYFTFALSLIIAYLVLAAQFESFLHPLIIMTTVPLAITGALLGLWVFGSSLNIYSQIGAIMLIGLAAKNGVLIVEFANQLRDRGMEIREAVIEAATIRLRPVLMTSICTAFGAIPLLLASGAGELSRRSIGAVIFFGVTLAVLLTLFVVPTVYALVARKTHSPEYVARMIEKLQKAAAGKGVMTEKAAE